MQERERISKRLRPLYAAHFLQGFVLWYATEKLFLHSIRFDDSQIALTGILISATLVLLQIPSGILADRWSRKGVIIVANIFLMLSTLVGGLSHNTFFYVSSILWGAFAAFCFETYDAIVYDAIEEETGNSEGYERYYGRLILYYSLALVAGALLSGVVGQLISLRATFWLSLPISILSILALLKFKEPTIHKTHAGTSLIRHTQQTFQAVIQKRALIWIIVPLLLFTMLARLVDNLGSLWYLGFGLPVIFWGPAYALLMMSFGLAGPIASLVKSSRFKMVGLGLLIGLMSLSLVSSNSVVIVIVAQAGILTGYGAFSMLLNHHLHDAISSNVRAGAASTIAALAQLIFLPTAYFLGWLSDKYTVFGAAWLVVAITAVTLAIFCFKVLPKQTTFSLTAEDMTDIETYMK